MRSVPAPEPSGCGLGRWVTSCRFIIRCGWQKKSPSSTRCWAAAWKLGSFPASIRTISARSDFEYGQRKSPTLEFVDYMRAAFGETQPFSYHGQEFHTDNAQISVMPVQQPHPPLWMMSRDPQTLEFCAKNRINPGYFLVYPRGTRRRATGNFCKTGSAWVGRRSQRLPTARWFMSTRPTRKRSTTRCSGRAVLTVFLRNRESLAKHSKYALPSTPRCCVGRGEPGARNGAAPV